MTGPRRRLSSREQAACQSRDRLCNVAQVKSLDGAPCGCRHCSCGERRLAATARFPDDQAARETDNARVLCTLDHAQKTLGRHTPKVVQVHIDCRQWRACLGGDDLPVIEPDDGYITRDGSAALAQTVEHAAGDDVAAAEDGVDAFFALEQLPSGVIAPTLRPGAIEDARAGQVDPMLLENRAHAFVARGDGFTIGWAGDVRQLAATES